MSQHWFSRSVAAAHKLVYGICKGGRGRLPMGRIHLMPLTEMQSPGFQPGFGQEAVLLACFQKGGCC